MHRHVNPDGSLGGVVYHDVAPDMWVLHEDEIRMLCKLNEHYYFDTFENYNEWKSKLNRPMTGNERDEIYKDVKPQFSVPRTNVWNFKIQPHFYVPISVL